MSDYDRVRQWLQSGRESNQVQPIRRTPRPSWAKRLEAQRAAKRKLAVA